ncbi:MAG: hypothetical protein R6X20_08250, partial [Phycisphaerae bacterium]
MRAGGARKIRSAALWVLAMSLAVAEAGAAGPATEAGAGHVVLAHTIDTTGFGTTVGLRLGDLDGDGRDELACGFALLDHDGTRLWEADLPGHADAVAVGDVDGNPANGAE